MWTLFGYGAAQALRLLNNMLLTHLLAPDAFGVMALVNVTLQGLQMISEVGVSQGIVQSKRGEDQAFLDTAWTIQVGRGWLIWAAAAAISPLLAAFYEEPSLTWLIGFAALSVVIDGLTTTAFHTARRRMQVRQVTLIELAAQAAAAVTMCGWAYYQPTIWALVAGSLVSPVIKVGLCLICLPDSGNRFAWEAAAAREIVSFAKWILVGMMIAFAAMQADRILLGKLMDLRTLGVYSIALTLAMLPAMVVERLAMYVLFPVFSSINRNSGEQLGATVATLRASVLTAGAAFMLCIYGGADWFFHTLYHESFAEAADITRLLCLATWITLLSRTVDRALLAMAKTRCLAEASLAKLVVTVAAVIVGHRWFGLPGFCLGVAVGGLAGHLALYPALRRAGIRVLSQDIAFTMLLVGGVLGLELLQTSVESALPGWGEAAACVAPLLVAAAALYPAHAGFAVVQNRVAAEGTAT